MKTDIVWMQTSVSFEFAVSTAHALLTRVHPSIASAAGGTTITVTAAFLPNLSLTVTVGGVPAWSVTEIADPLVTSFVVVLPHMLIHGIVDVVVMAGNVSAAAPLILR